MDRVYLGYYESPGRFVLVHPAALSRWHATAWLQHLLEVMPGVVFEMKLAR